GGPLVELDLLAGFDVQDVQAAAVIDGVEPVADNHGGTLADHGFFHLPDLSLIGQLAGAEGVDGDQGAHCGAGHVFFAVPGVDLAVQHDRGDVQSAPREVVVPDSLAGPRLHGPHVPVAGAEDHGRLSVEDG